MPRRRSKARTAESILDRLLDPLDLLGDAWGWLGAQLRFLGAAWRDQRAVKVFSLILLAALGLRLMRPEWYSHRTF
ncbi:MAG TPA: hypothetical protein VNZ67_08960, partial [bacterium]|nr:hypothetical protein [bacterium]